MTDLTGKGRSETIESSIVIGSETSLGGIPVQVSRDLFEY